MRRAVTIVTLLALMAGFGFGVNRLIASRKSKIPTEATVYIPTATRTSVVLPGTLFLAQNGEIYRLSDGFFTNLHLSVAKGQWMQPAYVPGTQDLVAVLRSAEFSNMYLLNSQGGLIRQVEPQRDRPDPEGVAQPLDVLAAFQLRREHDVLQLRPAQEFGHLRGRFLDMVRLIEREAREQTAHQFQPVHRW